DRIESAPRVRNQPAKFQRRSDRRQTRVTVRRAVVSTGAPERGALGSGMKNVLSSPADRQSAASSRKTPRAPTAGSIKAPNGGPMLEAIGMAAWTVEIALAM